MDDGAANDDGIRSQSPSPTETTPPPTSGGVTVAASPHPQTLTLALPIQTASASSGGGGGRDDCWSEGATSALIDAWGERYLELGRGSLKQKHWQEVADAVSARDDYTKPPKSDVQCKNRVDTLKKKYKSERSKIAAGGSGGQTRRSAWPFFHRLDILIGPNLLKQQPPPKPAPFPPQFPQRSRTQTVANVPNPVAARKRPRSASPPPPQPPPTAAEDPDGPPPDGIGELTRAIRRFGEVYERVERAKAQQMAEAERQRMGFEREIELQRMQFFIKVQMEISQLDNDNHRRSKNEMRGRRRHRRSSTNGNGNDGGGSNNSD